MENLDNNETQSFGTSYAGIYDLLYQDKDYTNECNFLLQLFDKHLKTTSPKVLDFGCGTGNHTLKLRSQGLNIEGVDQSIAMLRIANEKAREQGLNLPLLRELPLEQRYDAVLSLFAVVNYFDGKPAVEELFRNLSELLSPEGILVVETWNGVAVPFLSERTKTKEVRANGRKILRETKTRLNWKEQILDIHFTCYEGDKRQLLCSEEHRMHYYTVAELEKMAENAGLRIRAIYPAFQMKEPSFSDFNLIYLLEKRSENGRVR